MRKIICKMKKLLTIPILLITLMFSSTSYAEWTNVGALDGDTFYLDFERIRKVDGYVYYWTLLDYLKPDEFGYLSLKMYLQGDCKLFRYKKLSNFIHKEPMGEGNGYHVSLKDPEWGYPVPTSAHEAILNQVCDKVK